MKSLTNKREPSRWTYVARPSLSMLPLEIKQRIVYCVAGDDWTDQWYQRDPDTEPLLALSLVDRTFYLLCRPLIWKELELGLFTVTKLKNFGPVIARLARYVQRFSSWPAGSKMPSVEDDSLFELNGYPNLSHPEWDQSLRMAELARILKCCTNVTDLTLTIWCPTWELSDNNIPNDDQLTWKVVNSISQLTNLTDICITTNSTAEAFQEEFLVRLIYGMHHLKVFSCDDIKASVPDDGEPMSCRSPLGLHLASLSSLQRIGMVYAECFDLSWSAIEWKGRLESLTLEECPRGSLQAIHAFFKKFSSTLTDVQLKAGPSHLEELDEAFGEDEAASIPPPLRNLGADSPALDLRSFKPLQPIKVTIYGNRPDTHFYERRIFTLNKQRGGWFPKLYKLVLLTDDSNWTEEEIERLVSYLHRGVQLMNQGIW